MSPSEPQGPDVESIQLSLDADGTGIVRSAAEATVAETDAATLARIEAARAEFEELPPDPAAPSSSTHWAVLTALDAMPALRARRLGRPGSRPADGVISFTVIEREALAHEQPLRVARALDRADRPRFVEERRRRCEWAHASTLARLRRDPRVHGVDVSWLTESIHVVADADAVFDIARWPGVERISPNAAVRSHSAFSGIGNRYVTRAAEEIEAGNLGRPSSGDRIHVAVIDRYWPHVGHAAFQESRTDETSRLTSALDCNQCFTQIFGICTAYGCRAPGREVPRPEVPHGTTVPFLIGGSIEEGQVSTIRGRDTRIARSGIASEVDFQSFVVADCDAIGRALQNAASSADVIAMAVTGDSVCSAAYDCGDLVRTIGAIASDGPLIVAPGGRGALVTSPTCNLSFPANLPGVLAVAAYDNESTVPLAYTAAPVALYSPTGGAPIRVTSREPPLSTISEMIGVTGPGLVTLFPDIRTREGFVVSTVRGTRGDQGTSYAAAVVAGGLALQLGSFREVFGGDLRGGHALALALVSADGWQPTTDVRRQASEAPDRRAGMGRYRAMSPDTLAESTWGFASGTFPPGTYEFPVNDPGPDDVTEWRWAVVTTTRTAGQIGTRSMNDVQDDFVLEVIDTCGPQGATPLRDDYSFNLRKRIRLDRATICPPNRTSCRCLAMRMTVLSTATVAMVDLSHRDTEVP